MTVISKFTIPDIQTIVHLMKITIQEYVRFCLSYINSQYKETSISETDHVALTKITI